MPVGKCKDAHTATFPESLPERIIACSTSEKGACTKCGKAWVRVTHKAEVGGNERRDGSVQGDAPIPPPKTLGWEPTCKCGIKDVVPCRVLDPFAGTGTTLTVAKRMGRDWLGIELNERDYGPIIVKRLGLG
jgi:hypothetical protein